MLVRGTKSLAESLEDLVFSYPEGSGRGADFTKGESCDFILEQAPKAGAKLLKLDNVLALEEEIKPILESAVNAFKDRLSVSDVDAVICNYVEEGSIYTVRLEIEDSKIVSLTMSRAIPVEIYQEAGLIKYFDSLEGENAEENSQLIDQAGKPFRFMKRLVASSRPTWTTEFKADLRGEETQYTFSITIGHSAYSAAYDFSSHTMAISQEAGEDAIFRSLCQFESALLYSSATSLQDCARGHQRKEIHAITLNGGQVAPHVFPAILPPDQGFVIK